MEVTCSRKTGPASQPKKSRDNKTAKKAKAAGVSEKTAEHAHAIVENRPDLALKVKDGKRRLNEAVREMHRQDTKGRLNTLAAREVATLTGAYDVVSIDPP